MVATCWSGRGALGTTRNDHGMTRLHPIGDTLSRNRLLDVVFVHGAGGHYLNSWGSMLDWLLNDQDLADIGVWSLEHESDKFWSGGQGSLVRSELVRNLLQEMMQVPRFLEASPEMPIRPICWVAHSEGGNVVKQFLQHCQLQRGGNMERAAGASAILDSTRSVYFIDTPHRGSWVARFPLPGIRRRVRELRAGDRNLIELDVWYVDNSDGKFKSVNFYQAGERFKPVGTASVELDRAENIAIDRDHNQIAKPANKNTPPYPQINRDLRKIYTDVHKSSLPVPAAPLRLERGIPVLAREPVRLLCFVERQLGAFHPDAFGRPQAEQFQVKFWLSQGDGLPDRLDQTWIEGLAGDQLADLIACVYRDQLNENREGRLLLALFLPHKDLVADGLPEFLQQLRSCAMKSMPNSTGIPLLLACSSRWPVGSSAHPTLSKTRADIRKASDQLIRTLFPEPSQGTASMGCLNWLMIKASPADTPQASTQSLWPNAFPSVVDGKEVFRSQDGSACGGEEDAIDPLANRNAVYLSEMVGGAQIQSDPNPIDHLLMRGIPLIWCAKPQPFGGCQEQAAGMHSSHPMDSILAWGGLTFLTYFYRYQHERRAEEDNSSLRRFIRDGIIFWEDHRHIPTEPTLSTNSASAPLTPFQVPFHPQHP
jgi:hypothetical protein